MLDDPRDDARLLSAYANGDVGAFDVLYERHRGWVGAVARRFCRTPEDAIDVVQDTFAYLIVNAGRLRLTVPMRALLYPVVKHTALVRVRKRRGIRAEDAIGVVESLCEPPVHSADDEAMALLSEAMANLPDTQREVLLMRTLDDMTLAEIAVALAIPVGTVKSRLHLALQSLRAGDKLGRWFHGEHNV